MDLIAGWSPVFRAPWREWKLTEIGRPRHSGPVGVLSLRVGYCSGPAPQYASATRQRIKERRHAGETVETSEQVRSSLVPVILVDGERVATGWGRLALPLSPGRHLVEVQSQHSRAWRVVDIQAGTTAKLDYVGMLSGMHRFYGSDRVWGIHAHLHGYTLGVRGHLHLWQYLPVNARRRRSWNFAMLAAAVAVLCMIILRDLRMPMPWGGSAPAPGVLLALVLVCFLFWLVRVAWSAAQYNYYEPGPSLDTGSIGRFGAHPVLVLDPDGEAPKPESGLSAIVIDARFLKDDLSMEDLLLQAPPEAKLSGARKPRLSRQRRRLDKIGEFAPVRHRFAVPPPEILLDDRPLAGSWTRMWVQLVPGSHRLTVRAPGAPMPVRGGRESAEVQSIEFTVGEGSTAGVDVTVTVEAVPDLTEPVLHRWTSRVIRLCGGPVDPVQRVKPSVDVEAFLEHAFNSQSSLATFPSRKNRMGPGWFTPGPQTDRFRWIPTVAAQHAELERIHLHAYDEHGRRSPGPLRSQEDDRSDPAPRTTEPPSDAAE